MANRVETLTEERVLESLSRKNLTDLLNMAHKCINKMIDIRFQVTAKELATLIRHSGKERDDEAVVKVVNQILYCLHEDRLVERIILRGKPYWFLSRPDVKVLDLKDQMQAFSTLVKDGMQRLGDQSTVVVKNTPKFDSVRVSLDPLSLLFRLTFGSKVLVPIETTNEMVTVLKDMFSADIIRGPVISELKPLAATFFIADDLVNFDISGYAKMDIKWRACCRCMKISSMQTCECGHFKGGNIPDGLCLAQMGSMLVLVPQFSNPALNMHSALTAFHQLFVRRAREEFYPVEDQINRQRKFRKHLKAKKTNPKIMQKIHLDFEDINEKVDRNPLHRFTDPSFLVYMFLRRYFPVELVREIFDYLLVRFKKPMLVRGLQFDRSIEPIRRLPKEQETDHFFIYRLLRRIPDHTMKLKVRLRTRNDGYIRARFRHMVLHINWDYGKTDSSGNDFLVAASYCVAGYSADCVEHKVYPYSDFVKMLYRVYYICLLFSQKEGYVPVVPLWDIQTYKISRGVLNYIFAKGDDFWLTDTGYVFLL